PTDGKTTPFYKGGYVYERLGGSSSTFPYLAGVFALALQANPDFAKQKGWQSRLMGIAADTADESFRIRPPAIVAKAASQNRLDMLKAADAGKGM
ncbi:MAG: hypothetical protein LBO78_01515, partial [Rickettsiales bacterium]|nr:hypothetical protein [Rickettsiales bacterium]